MWRQMRAVKTGETGVGRKRVTVETGVLILVLYQDGTKDQERL